LGRNPNFEIKEKLANLKILKTCTWNFFLYKISYGKVQFVLLKIYSQKSHQNNVKITRSLGKFIKIFILIFIILMRFFFNWILGKIYRFGIIYENRTKKLHLFLNFPIFKFFWKDSHLKNSKYWTWKNFSFILKSIFSKTRQSLNYLKISFFFSINPAVYKSFPGLALK
jgi:hypothetical protein